MQLNLLLSALLWTASPDTVATAGVLEPGQTRVLVLTDISSLTAGQAEPDDGQSLIRFLLHGCDFEVEGLVASSNLGHGQQTRPQLIHRAIDAYEQVWTNLRLHDLRYPPPDRLRAVVKAGQPVAGPNVAVESSVGDGKDTSASRHIIEVVDRQDTRPLWVLIWGGSADLAQALWRVREDRGAEATLRFLRRIRVHSIGDQDATGQWIKQQFPDLYVITQQRAFRGMYRGGDTTLASSEWVQAHTRNHGALGDLYPDYRGGDIWSRTLGPVRGIKEGDSPSFLALIPNGLTDLESPALSSWGGRFEGAGYRLVDMPDPSLLVKEDPDPRMSSVHRWRPAFQNEFQARLDWCFKPYAEANHPPLIKLAKARTRTAEVGEPVVLDARTSLDPDGDKLQFQWGIDPSAPSIAAITTIEDAENALARLTPAPDLAGQTLPVLLTVTDQGDPPLTRYARVFITVNPAKENHKSK